MTQAKYVALNSSILPPTNISLKYNRLAFHPQTRSSKFQRPKWDAGSPSQTGKKDPKNSNL